MSRSEFLSDDPHADPIDILEQHLLAGFPPDLALDLVLNELVVRAAEATHATAAALALARNDERSNEMVCRAATGDLAPDLGVPLNTRDGLSGACLETRQPQLSVDTEFDPRVDPAVSRRLGIRSILIVPVFDINNHAKFSGVLEVFSTSPAAFSTADQKLLEGFARECARINQAALERSQRKPDARLFPSGIIAPEFLQPEFVPPEFAPAIRPPVNRTRYEMWTLVLGALAILAIISVSFLIGSRIGWLSLVPSHAEITQSSPTDSIEPAAPCVATAAAGCPPVGNSEATAAVRLASHAKSESASEKTSRQPSPAPAPPADELVVYEKGRVIFRMKPASAKTAAQTRNLVRSGSTTIKKEAIVKASSTTKVATPNPLTGAKAIAPVWISPTQADTRLLSRTEPHYPPEALATHRSGNVVLEVQVTEEGSVSNIRTLSGDPVLAAAAADAVRNWRYQPYRRHDRPAQFQTDVTLSFALPN
jgi:TonB family protein